MITLPTIAGYYANSTECSDHKLKKITVWKHFSKKCKFSAWCDKGGSEVQI